MEAQRRKNDQKKRKNLVVLVVIIAILIIASFSSIWYYAQSSKQKPTNNTMTVISSLISQTSEPLSSSTIKKNLALDFSLVDLEGNNFSLNHFRGKIIIIDFMAIWCGPCKDQIPHLGVVWEQYQDDIIIISIDVDPNETPEMLADFASNFPYATWIWATDSAHIGYDYEIYSIPTMIIVDQEGYISVKHVGKTSSPQLIEEIEKLLG